MGDLLMGARFDGILLVPVPTLGHDRDLTAIADTHKATTSAINLENIHSREGDLNLIFLPGFGGFGVICPRSGRPRVGES